MTTREYHVQGEYGLGWEDLTVETDIRAARQRLHEYDTEEPQYRHRIANKRGVTVQINPKGY